MAGDFTYTSSRGNTYKRKNDVDYNAIWTEEQKRADEQTAQFTAGANASKDQYISDISAAGDASIKAAREAAAQQQRETAEEYVTGFDMNAASELAARRNLQEQMANLGLTKSGYNATNQTALQIGRANADAETRRQKQAAVDKIRQALAEYEAGVADDIAKKQAAAAYETRQLITQQTAANRADAESRALNRYAVALSEQDALNDFIWDVEQQENAKASGGASGSGAAANEEILRVRGYMDQYYNELAKGNKDADIYKERAMSEIYAMENWSRFASADELAYALYQAGISESDYEAYRSRLEASPVLNQYTTHYQTTK